MKKISDLITPKFRKHCEKLKSLSIEEHFILKRKRDYSNVILTIFVLSSMLYYPFILFEKSLVVGNPFEISALVFIFSLLNVFVFVTVLCLIILLQIYVYDLLTNKYFEKSRKIIKKIIGNK